MSRDDEIRSRLQRRVANLAENHELIDVEDVADVSRDLRCVQLRHEWFDCDGEEEIYARICAAAMRLAQGLADGTGRSVELRDYAGGLIDIAVPSEDEPQGGRGRDRARPRSWSDL